MSISASKSPSSSANTEIVFTPAAQRAMAARGSAHGYARKMAAGFPERVTPDLAGFIAEAYRRGLTPEFWKIEGTLSRDGARTIDTAIAANRACRQIILGKAADLATIDRWFAAAAASPTAVGFAIGRSVFWEPSAAFLGGSRTADRAAADICATYLQLVDAWQQSHV